MTRLRVSAVFFRSVEEHCIKMDELRGAVLLLHAIPDHDKRLIGLKKLLSSREKLLIEVGRMIRLGRLLRTRLREPFILDEKSQM